MSSMPQLNYAQRPPITQRRRFRRSTTVAAFLAFILSSYWWAAPGVRHVRLLYWQHQCMIYIPPANQMIFDPVMKRSVVPQQWLNFYRLFSPPGSRPLATLYMHEMSSPTGQSQLVVVDVSAAAGNAAPILVIRVFAAGKILRSPAEFPVHIITDFDSASSKVFAGNIDPADPTHFSVRVLNRLNDETIYDGWLQNDNTVMFGKRNISSAHR